MDTSDPHDYFPTQEEEAEVEEEENEANEEAKGNNNTHNFPQTMETGMRYGLSRNQIANLINSLLVDLLLLFPNLWDPLASLFVCASKVRLMIKALGKELAKSHLDKHTGLFFVGWDGKKSDVLRDRGQMESVEKETVICQILRIYIDHFLPSDGRAESIAKGLLEVNIKVLKVNTQLDLLSILSPDFNNDAVPSISFSYDDSEFR